MLKFLTAFLVALSACIYAKDNPKDKFYVCAIFQHEARFLDHWIEFHLRQGADKIYLYNNNSNDDYMRVLYKYIRGGVVVFKQWPYESHGGGDWNTVQCNAYKDCVERVKNKVEWVAFIDTDEFLFSPLHKRVSDVLNLYSDVDAVGVNWMMYGTNGIDYLIDGRLTENMLMRAPADYAANIHVKTIVRPKKVADCVNPHYFVLVPGAVMVNENQQQMLGPFSNHSSEILRINHYWLRDLTFLREVKAPRRGKWYGEALHQHMEADKGLNQVYDPILKDFWLD